MLKEGKLMGAIREELENNVAIELDGMFEVDKM